MSDFLLSEVQRLAQEAARWELYYHRAVAGARGANRGVERMRIRMFRAQNEATIARGRVERLEHEVSEQQKKITRLSLQLLSFLDQSQGG